jgi:hypothetical protein
LEISEPKILSKPSADIKLSQGNEGIIQNESFPVIPKKLDKGDFYRTVKHSELCTIDSHASKLLEGKTKWDEIIMTVCAIGFGATISSLFSSVKLETTLGIIFFILIPILSFSGTVFVIMFKLMNRNNERNFAHEIRNIVEPHLTKFEE